VTWEWSEQRAFVPLVLVSLCAFLDTLISLWCIGCLDFTVSVWPVYTLCGSNPLCRRECGHFESQAYAELTSLLHSHKVWNISCLKGYLWKLVYFRTVSIYTITSGIAECCCQERKDNKFPYYVIFNIFWIYPLFLCVFLSLCVCVCVFPYCDKIRNTETVNKNPLVSGCEHFRST
jgi:hypothetical protein